MATCRVAIVAAMEREVSALVRNWRRVQRQHEGRTFTFFESADAVCICGGIGPEPARRAAEAAIILHHPALIQSVGFAGALDTALHIGNIFIPSTILDTRDGSRIQIEQGTGTLLTFPHIATAAQKHKLAEAYAAQAVDMEAAAVAAAAAKHGTAFAAAKAISDEVDFELPNTERFIDHQGRFQTASFILFALIRPWLWPRIVKLAANSRKAAIALTRHLESNLRHGPNQLSATTLTARRPT